jgi:hypothetical protein
MERSMMYTRRWSLWDIDEARLVNGMEVEERRKTSLDNNATMLRLGFLFVGVTLR